MLELFTFNIINLFCFFQIFGWFLTVAINYLIIRRILLYFVNSACLLPFKLHVAILGGEISIIDWWKIFMVAQILRFITFDCRKLVKLNDFWFFYICRRSSMELTARWLQLEFITSIASVKDKVKQLFGTKTFEKALLLGLILTSRLNFWAVRYLLAILWLTSLKLTRESSLGVIEVGDFVLLGNPCPFDGVQVVD